MKSASAALFFLSIAIAAPGRAAVAQAPRAGSDAELYERISGLVSGRPELFSAIRPLAPHRATGPDWLPWSSRTAASSVWLLPTSVRGSWNGSFPWFAETGAWAGRGPNASLTTGAGARFGPLYLQLEPLLSYAANRRFELENTGVGFADGSRPGSIDLPQRFGDRAITLLDWGESFARLDIRGLAAGFSNERIFWGPGVRHSLLLSGTGFGFPHVFVGTGRPLRTRVGAFEAQVVYARLEESRWAPPAPTPARFGSGFVATWRPLPGFELGLARFYHRAWPESFRGGDLFAPFGSLFFDAQIFAGGIPDNQLASIFFSQRVRRAHLEVWGEFGRNDRSSSLRDFYLEPEHNAAWLAGFLKAFAIDSLTRSFWSARLEVADARIGAIQERTRQQSMFYEHGSVTQGHTSRGMLIGTPLIDRAAGAELAIDRWTTKGRAGLVVFERQMPPDGGFGMPADRTRTQWDVAVDALRFTDYGSVSVRLGNVWDLHRYRSRNASNAYVRVGYQFLPPMLAPALFGR